ncbi:hypothetical protein [Roseococcus pinisoli]|uniref:Uncharacterized protein n=1 Tax=Roseococcus pinisoli TaxID=2835040 RepID=A0ABS5QH58_9PROT|nr:hypothetical protein [Roseococcus pinisoli]MBS7812272.1 hypothetical protein [Roseococcus pinisoli]
MITADAIGKEVIVIRRWNEADSRLKIGMSGVVRDVVYHTAPKFSQYVVVGFPFDREMKFYLDEDMVVLLKESGLKLVVHPPLSALTPKQPQLPWC